MEFVLLVLFGFCGGFICATVFLRNENKLKSTQNISDKLYMYYEILNLWLEMKQKGKSPVTYLEKKGIKKIAIYGMKELGERLYEELKKTDIEVLCVIDKNPRNILGDFTVISPQQKIPEVDAIIVTADYYFREIESELKTKASCPVYSLTSVLGNSFGRNI